MAILKFVDMKAERMEFNFSVRKSLFFIESFISIWSNLFTFIASFFSSSIFRQIFMKVRQLHKDENGAMNGKGLMGDSSTDPLSINVHTVSSDEVILREIQTKKKNLIEILSNSLSAIPFQFLIFVLLKINE